MVNKIHFDFFKFKTAPLNVSAGQLKLTPHYYKSITQSES